MIRVFLDGLRRRLGEVAAVDRVSLEVRPGEWTWVTGAPGAGKTTLCRIVAGLDTADEGEIYFDGRAVHRLTPGERRVGLVAAGDALWPHETVAENVGLGLRLQSIRRRERRRMVLEALGLVGLDSQADRYPDDLTPLQSRRVALARAAVVDPNLLLIDEPTVGLDPIDAADFREDLKRVRSELATTALAFTSDPDEALRSADTLALMHLGRIVQVGPPGEVYARPADVWSARFLGRANLLSGTVEGEDSRGDVVVRTALGKLSGHGRAGDLKPGNAVMLCIRPEAVSLAPTGTLGVNRFAATVGLQEFRGAVRSVWLSVPNGGEIEALTLSAAAGLREGQLVNASVSPEHVVVLGGTISGRAS